jgi:hypothetical protein
MPARQQQRSASKNSRSRARRSVKAKPPRPTSRETEAPHVQSPTAVAAEALRTGVPPKRLPRHKDEIPREEEKMRMGDPDDSVMQNEYSGEDTAGGSTPTPDQNDVDEIGRAYGLQDEDSGTLRSGEEVLGRRDKHRPELRAPRRPQP